MAPYTIDEALTREASRRITDRYDVTLPAALDGPECSRNGSRI